MTRRQTLIIAIAGLALAVGVRLIHYNQSLWCDEMEIPSIYAHANWSQIVAPGAGQYTPNNHVLYIIFAKAILALAGNQSVANITHLIRLPSLIAGSLIPLALAWPLRHRAPMVAIFVLLIAAVQPWLIAFSDEARGYALMTLLGILATNLLPDGQKRWPIAYAVVVALMIYTVPVAGMLLIAHGLTVALLRPTARRAWLRGAILGGGAALLLFLPMANGIRYYIHHPEPPPDSFLDFANSLPRFAFAGEYLPVQLDPASHAPDPSWGIIFWIVPVAVFIIGSLRALRQPELRMPTTTMAIATLIFLVAAIVIPGAGQERFVPWAALWLVISLSAIAIDLYRRNKIVALLCVVLPALCWFAFRDIILLPSQPIREAIMQANAMAPADSHILVAFLASEDSVRFYAPAPNSNHIIATPHTGDFLQAEQDARNATRQSPWLVLSYEAMIHDGAPQFWQYIQANYQLKARIPGRITPVAIYSPRRNAQIFNH